MKRTPRENPWSEGDTAIWHTCVIARDIFARRVPQLRVGTIFALREHEIAFAKGVVRIDEWRADGDGTYSTSHMMMVGTGSAGLALGVATALGSAVGNANRRARAAQAATPMWRPIVAGSVVVTSHGFYISDQTGTFSWDWASITALQIMERGVVNLQGQSDRGPINWMITSDWAELIFLLWAAARHPQHPQYLAAAWIPPGWPERAERMGYPLPPAIEA